ncbi:hypothetical protein H0H87_006407 [Tephrocybe sp. NHM501043]|nr:hypothetical protein H0H87_006407 [Tephrocybe sp. NHM501043]
MYCDDDLKDERHALNVGNQKPFLRLYEDREEEHLRTTAEYLREIATDSQGESDDSAVTEGIDFMRYCRVLAFFGTVQGFYKGNLDLTGRHSTVSTSSYLAMISGLTPDHLRSGCARCRKPGIHIVASFLALTVIAIPHTYDEYNQYLEEVVTVTDYKFEDCNIWESFCKEWKIPRAIVTYELLLHHTQETLNVIAHAVGAPKIQKLCLVDLPSELLDAIFSHTSTPKARLLSSTCRKLDEIGRRHLVSRLKSFYKDLDESDLPEDQFVARVALNLIASMCRIPKLESLALVMCTISKKSQQTLLLGDSYEKSPWFAMLFCPNLQNFCARAVKNALLPPPGSLWEMCRFFPTLKYLLLAGLSSFHVPGFAEWITHTAQELTPQLTHFKIAVQMSMSDSHIISILRSLRSAPLEILCIDGAYQADPALFDWLSEHFPDLLGLTVSRRDSIRQKRNRPTLWPIPIYRYAERFLAFTRLQHFGWNNASFSTTYSTSLLLLLENGGLNEDDYAALEEARVNENFDLMVDSLWTPKLFGIYCPSLRTISESMISGYSITHPGDGIVKAELVFGGGSTDTWDPNSFFGQWPRVTIPSAKGDPTV